MVGGVLESAGRQVKYHPPLTWMVYPVMYPLEATVATTWAALGLAPREDDTPSSEDRGASLGQKADANRRRSDSDFGFKVVW